MFIYWSTTIILFLLLSFLSIQLTYWYNFYWYQVLLLYSRSLLLHDLTPFIQKWCLHVKRRKTQNIFNHFLSNQDGSTSPKMKYIISVQLTPLWNTNFKLYWCVLSEMYIHSPFQLIQSTALSLTTNHPFLPVQLFCASIFCTFLKL